jgi:CelD/BcsL family acetyltransferase involved in cellulose biosynthesis
VLVGRTVEDAYARGLTDYDFLRGEEPYKLDWAWDRRQTCALRAAAPGLRAAASEAVADTFRGARALARSMVPAATWSALARARRSLAVNGPVWARAGARARP